MLRRRLLQREGAGEGAAERRLLLRMGWLPPPLLLLPVLLADLSHRVTGQWGRTEMKCDDTCERGWRGTALLLCSLLCRTPD